MTDKLKVGVAGAAGRGKSFKAGLEANGAVVRAVCDIRSEALDEAAALLGAEMKFASFDEMLDKAGLDAVVVGTPMQFHAPMSIAALERNVSVLSEVTAAVSLDEAKALARAAAKSKAVYMMAENYAYMRPNVVIRELARQGLFGDMFYAEGEYLHELKALNERTTWRRKWQTGVAGITYGTHSLGPILQWMGGDRVARVCCEGTGSHYLDPRGEAYAQDSATMLCKTVRGALIKIRVDMISDRPHAMTNYQLQGKDGAYESGRGGPADRAKLWLRALSAEPRWFDFESLMGMDDFAEKYVPEIWRRPPPEALKAGHGGGDYFEVRDFVRAVRGEAPCPIGIHEALDMTLPGLVSQLSAAQGGAWLSVPDSRRWADGKPERQLVMRWPPEHHPSARAPKGYRVRPFRAGDEEGWLRLMARAGFEKWDQKRLDDLLRAVLPQGLFVVEHRATSSVAATACAQHRPWPGFPSGGEVGWVASDPDHRGHGLGRCATAAAVARLLGAGYRNVYLLTDDFRTPAIKTYLKLGFEPVEDSEEMKARWAKARQTAMTREQGRALDAE